MSKKIIQIDIDKNELKKKLNIKDGYTPIKGKDYFDGKTPIIDTQDIAIRASKLAQVELEKKIVPPAPFKITDKEIEDISLDVQSQIEPKFEELKKEIETNKILSGQRINTGFKAFRNLTDAPHSYNGQASKLVSVKSDETGLEFIDPNTIDNQNLQEVTDNGATTDNKITLPAIQFDTTATPLTNAEGLLQWNATDGTLDLGMDGGDITMQVGQELFTKVRNESGYETISNGQVVYISGRNGVFPTVRKAKANAESTSRVLGVATQDIASPDFGFVTTTGYVRGIKTNYTGTGIWGTTWVTGDLLYVSKTDAGVLTNVEPAAPHHSDTVGSVGVVSAAQGSILITLDRHKTLAELSDVDGTPLTTTGQIPVYHDGVNGYFDFDYNINDYLTESDFAEINRHGVVSRTETIPSFNGTNTFTLTSVGVTWSYYRAGIKYTVTGNKSVVIPGTPIASGTWFIYIDATDGTLTASQTVWNLLDTKVPIATINFNDSLTPKYWTSDERHSIVIDGYMQYYLHNVDGARSLNTPSLTGYTTNTDTNVAKTFAISAGTLVDQDIVHTLASLPDPDGTATDYVVWYRTGASTWAWKLSNMPFLYNSSTDWIQYDNAGTPTDLTGGAGALTRWTNSYLLLTNKSGASRFVITPGRGVFTSLADAKAESVGTFVWDGFPIAESVIVYQLTWSTITSTSQGKCRLASEPKLVNISTVTNNSSGAGTDHNTLSNLQGGTLGEYYHLTSAEKTVVANTSGTNTGDQNLSHTGEVTGTTQALTLDKTAISNRTDVTIDATDILLFGDTSDSNNLKKGAVQDILDLAGGGGSFGTVGQIPFTNATGDDFDYLSNITYDSASRKLSLVGNVTETIADVTTATATQISGTWKNFEAPLYTWYSLPANRHIFAIYAYKTLPDGIKLYSSNYYEVYVDASITPSPFDVQIDIIPVIGADGYAVIYGGVVNYYYSYYYGYDYSNGFGKFTTSTSITFSDNTADFVPFDIKFFSGDTVPVTAIDINGKMEFTTLLDWNFQGSNLLNIDTINHNFSFGIRSGESLTTGTGNFSLGTDAGGLTTTGYSNTFIGYGSGHSNTTGHSNVYLGYLAGNSNISGRQNVFIGLEAGKLNTSTQNVAIGSGAFDLSTTADRSVALGAESLRAVTTGINNTAIGAYAGDFITSARNNFIFGTQVTSYNWASDGIMNLNNMFLGSGLTLASGNSNSLPLTNPRMGIAVIPHEQERFYMRGGLMLGDSTGLGSEMLTNADITSDSGWTMGTGWTYSSSNYIFGGDTVGTLTQASGAMITPPVIGQMYYLSIAGGYNPNVSIGDNLGVTITVAGVNLGKITSLGNYIFVATSTDGITITPDLGSVIKIGSVSIKPVTQGSLTAGGNVQALGDFISADGSTGFTGTGAYTNFTIKNGIITNAS